MTAETARIRGNGGARTGGPGLRALISVICCTIAVLLGAAALAGWLFGTTVLTDVRTGWASTKVNTAVSMILGGIAVLLCAGRGRGKAAGLAIAVTLALFNALTLVEYIWGGSFGIDQLLVVDRTTAAGLPFPGRTPLAASIGFLAVAAAAALISDRRPSAASAAQWLAVGVCGLAYFAITGYLLDAPSMYAFFPYASLALPTAAGLGALGGAALVARPDGAVMSLARAGSPVGVLTRRLTLYGLSVPAALGWLRLAGERAGLYGAPFGVMVMVLANVVLLVSMIWLTGRSLKRAGQRLRIAEDRGLAVERRYHSTLDAMREGCQIIGRDWTYLYVNEAAAAHGRRPISDLLGRTMEEAYPGIQSTPMFAHLRECMEHGLARRLENEFEFPDGSKGWYDLSIQPVAEGLFILSTDVTERKRSEQALRESQVLLRTIVDLVPHFIFAKDRHSRHLFINRAGAAANGLEPAQMIGRNDLELAPDRGQAESFMRDDRRVIEQGVPLNVQELLTDRNGETRVLMTTKIPFAFPGSPEMALLGVAVDITEQKRAEAEVRRLNAELEERVRSRTAQLEAANQELEAFSYSVSHDLRAPLRHVGGFAELLSRRAGASLDDEGRRLLGKVTEAAARMARMIDELLVFSRMARSEVRARPLNLNEMVRETIAILAAGSESRRITWDVGDLPAADGDSSLLRLVLQNLLENAMKYTRPRDPAVISILGWTTDVETIISVRDNGVGFDPRYRDRLFGVFQRLHRAEDFEGNGIGLASVRRIIQRHGGRTWAEGEVGAGATFSFSLPRRSTEGGLSV